VKNVKDVKSVKSVKGVEGGKRRQRERRDIDVPTRGKNPLSKEPRLKLRSTLLINLVLVLSSPSTRTIKSI
jgi:hypothetical protein